MAAVLLEGVLDQKGPKWSFRPFWPKSPYQKNPRVHKIRVRNSGAGNGCANFMGAWKNALFLQENLHVHKIPRFRGGGFWAFGGGSADFYFYGREDFSERSKMVISTILVKIPLFQLGF